MEHLHPGEPTCRVPFLGCTVAFLMPCLMLAALLSFDMHSLSGKQSLLLTKGKRSLEMYLDSVAGSSHGWSPCLDSNGGAVKVPLIWDEVLASIVGGRILRNYCLFPQGYISAECPGATNQLESNDSKLSRWIRGMSGCLPPTSSSVGRFVELKSYKLFKNKSPVTDTETTIYCS